MKHFINYATVVVSGFVCLVSCAEQESELPSVSQLSNNQLSIVTHTREGDEASTPIASIYLFNGSNAFVRTLQTDADGSYTSASASVKLLADTYTLCALSSNDLSLFQFPETATATPTSVITSVGETMGDLLMETETVTLADGANEVVDMTLKRKVLELSTVTINQVPDDVKGVAVSISPLYSAIQFNGEYVDSNPTSCTITLTSTSTTGVWQAAPQKLVFPSKGVPTITVTFTRDDESTRSYTYTATNALSANNKYNIAGTYTEPLGVTFNGSITLQSWATDPTAVDFEFDENNAVNNSSSDPSSSAEDPNAGSGSSETSNPPVAGQQYKGCYVVSVNSDAKTAVLLSPTDGTGYSVEGYNATEWLNHLNTELSNWPSVEGVSGTWRIPTLEEIGLFAQPAGIISDLEQGQKKGFFCMENSELKIVEVRKSNKVAELGSILTSFNDTRILRPVINISY